MRAVEEEEFCARLAIPALAGFDVVYTVHFHFRITEAGKRGFLPHDVPLHSLGGRLEDTYDGDFTPFVEGASSLEVVHVKLAERTGSEPKE